MVYYTLATVKTDLGISGTDYDTILTNIATDADSEVDEEIKVCVRRSKNTYLPELPLSTTPQTIKEASHALIKSKFFTRPENFREELIGIHYKAFKRKVELFIMNREDTNEVYGDLV